MCVWGGGEICPPQHFPSRDVGENNNDKEGEEEEEKEEKSYCI